MVDPQSRFHVIIYYIHIIYTSKCSPIQAKVYGINETTTTTTKNHNIIVITEIIAFKLLKQLIINIFTHYGFERINNSYTKVQVNSV